MRGKVLIAAMACGIAVLAGRTAAAAQTTCPAEAARTRNNVVRFLTGENWASDRQAYGIAVSPSSLELMTDATDAAACQQLRAMVGEPQNARYPQVFSYYKAGGFYFVAFTWVLPEGRIWTGFTPLVILRNDFSYVDTYGM